MVVSQRAVASDIGAAILERGGNAVDAAVAVGFALAVALPRAGNIGGGGFMLIHLADGGTSIALDFRETAPAAAHERVFLDANGNVDEDARRFGHLSVGVPGTVAGLSHALEKYGTLTLREVLVPAIELARNGIEYDYDIASAIAVREQMLRRPSAHGEHVLSRGRITLLRGRHVCPKRTRAYPRINCRGRP